MSKKTNLVLCIIISLMMFASCDKEHYITLSQSSTTMYHGQTQQVPAQCKDPINYSSNNEYVAIVSPSGMITAQYVGQAVIRLTSTNDNKTYNVKVAPKYNLYPEPNITFGETKSSVISKYGNPDGQTSNTIVYSNYSTKALYLIVSFDANNRVKYYGVVVSKDYTTELSNFLSERYKYVSYSDGVYLYMNALTTGAATMAVSYGTFSGYNNSWLVAYMSSPSKESDFKASASEMETYFQ